MDRPPHRSSTIQDVAARAGVSVSTVSNVLNGREARMRADTLARVHEAIAELRFRPNQSARRLKTGHMPMVALMVPSIANPFFGVLARWVEESLLERGYGLVLCNTHRLAERERDYAEAFLSQGVRGVILGSALQAHEHLGPLVEQGLAAVSLDRVPADDGLARDFVSVDNHRAAEMALEHLIALGHRRIMFVGAPAKSMNRVARLEGARAACRRGGAELQVFLGSAPAGYDEGEMADLGRRAALDLVDARCDATAFVGVNDMIAIGLLAGLRQAGRQVPHDVSVMGIDGIYLGAYLNPALSTIGQPMREIAAAAVEHVLSRMKDPTLAPRVTILAPQLQLAGSTAPLAAAG